MSITQELKELAQTSEGMDGSGCWREVLYLHRELGRSENAVGPVAWTMRYGESGGWRVALRTWAVIQRVDVAALTNRTGNDWGAWRQTRRSA